MAATGAFSRSREGRTMSIRLTGLVLLLSLLLVSSCAEVDTLPAASRSLVKKSSSCTGSSSISSSSSSSSSSQLNHRGINMIRKLLTVELDDYPGTGANPKHDPSPPGSK